MIQTSAFKVAQSFIGVKETAGPMSDPLVLAMLQMDASWVENDETASASGDTKRLRQGTLNVEASVQSQLDRSFAKAGTPSPSGNGVGRAVESQKVYCSGISDLLSTCGPSAILRRVRSVVVDAFNGMVWRRLLTHVGQERFKRSDPALTDPDTTPAVIVVLRGALIQAASFHCAPRSVFSRERATMRSRRRWPRLAIATARDLLAARQCRGANETSSAAFAAANPVVSISVIPDRSQASKSLTRNVYQFSSAHQPYCTAA